MFSFVRPHGAILFFSLFGIRARIRGGRAPRPAWRTEMLRRFAMLVVILTIMPLHALCAEDAPDPDSAGEIVERRSFRGFVRRDMAERTARLAADLQVWEQAARLLAKSPDLHFISENNAAPSLNGLARMMYTSRIMAIGVEGFPPNQQAIVRVVPQAPENLRKALLDALQRQDLLEIYAHILSGHRKLLQQYDLLSARLLPLNPVTDGGREEMHRLKSIVNEMIALDIYSEILPQYNHNWSAPREAQIQLLNAEKLAPNNPLILTALAEVSLQMDRPVAALEYAGKAVTRAPEFARAHDVRGAVLLRQRLPSLAAESFGRAISLSPRNPIYHMHRASAYLVLEEETNMCMDFREACGLGDCEGLQWARGMGRCGANQ